MLLQTNSYIVPKDRRAEHARLLQRFRQTLNRLGCEHFETYEQVGANWSGSEATGRFVQIMRFNDRKHQQEVQNAEKTDPAAQQLIREFCELINFPYQQQQGLFAVGYYNSVLHGNRPGSAKPQAAEAVAPMPAEAVVDESDADAEVNLSEPALSTESVMSDNAEDFPSGAYEPLPEPPPLPADDVPEEPLAADAQGISPDELHVGIVDREPLDIDALLEESPEPPILDEIVVTAAEVDVDDDPPKLKRVRK